MIETAPQQIHIEYEAARGIAQIEELLRLNAEISPPDSGVLLGLGGIAAETASLRFAVGDTSQQEIIIGEGLPEDVACEKYNRSLRPYRDLGRVARIGYLETETGSAAFENVRRDLVTSLAEIFENGKEFRGGFEISDIYDYPVIDGQVYYRTADGLRPMLQVTETGAAASKAAAVTDPLMAPQAERDEADVHNAGRVDDIVSGRADVNTRIVVSRDLGGIIRQGSPHRELYIGKGYREGLSFLQLYFTAGKKLTAGTFSIDGVSDEVFNTVLARYGAALPEGESRHNSVKYGVELTLPDKAAAIRFVQDFRETCYALQNDKRERRSASQFIAEHAAEIDGYIEALCVPLAVSIDSGKKEQVLHDFVGNLLCKPENMKPEIVAHLRRIHSANTFTDEDGRLMSGILMYAIAEALYEGAKNYLKGKPLPSEYGLERQQVRPAYGQVPVDHIVRQLADGVHTGVEAGRTHSGGCPGEVALTNKDGTLRDPTNPQGAFGGKEGDDKESLASDKKGSMSFKCPNKDCKGINYRDYNQYRTHCKHCRKAIPRCGPTR